MSNRVVFRWKQSPVQAIGAPLIARVASLPPLLMALAATHAARGEAIMKSGAPWNDQTGYARGALYGRSEGTNIHLGTANDEYGLFLELGTSKMAARPIIVPTLETVATAYYRDVVIVIKGVLFG